MVDKNMNFKDIAKKLEIPLEEVLRIREMVKSFRTQIETSAYSA